MEQGSLCQIYSQIDFTRTNLASACQALLCTHAWAFVVKVGIPWMFTEWIKGLMGYEAKSFVWMRRSVKRKNIPTLGNLPTPAHHVTGLWALLTGATEWVLAQAQLWTGQHWKHTHVHMHHTNGGSIYPIVRFVYSHRSLPGSGPGAVGLSAASRRYLTIILISLPCPQRRKGKSDWHRHTNGSGALQCASPSCKCLFKGMKRVRTA